MATITIKYDDLDFSESVESYDTGSPNRLDLMQVPKRHGALVAEVPVLDPRRVSFRGKVSEGSASLTRNTLDLLEKTFHRNNKKLRIWDDRYLNAYLVTFGYSFIPGTAGQSAAWSAEFVAADPFWYSDTAFTQTQTLDTADIADATHGGRLEVSSIVNPGTAFAYPTMTITNSTGSSVTRISIINRTTGRTFTYTGTLLNGQSLIVDCGQFTVKNNGVDDLTNFSGSFLWFDPGTNSMEIQGFALGAGSITYKFDFITRYF